MPSPGFRSVERNVKIRHLSSLLSYQASKTFTTRCKRLFYFCEPRVSANSRQALRDNFKEFWYLYACREFVIFLTATRRSVLTLTPSTTDYRQRWIVHLRQARWMYLMKPLLQLETDLGPSSPSSVTFLGNYLVRISSSTIWPPSSQSSLIWL